MTRLLFAVGWTDPSVWLVLAALVLIWFSISRSLRRRGGGTSSKNDDDVQLDRQASVSSAQRLSDTASQWEVRLHELARDLEGKLNSKLGLLEQLIREADRAAARLETALRTADQIRKTQMAGILPSLPRSDPAGGSNVPPKDESDGGGTGPRLEDQLNPAQEEGYRQPSGADPSPDRSDGPLQEKGHSRRSIEEIYTLADYGYSVEEIAQRTATPSGEVQLILSLRRSRPASEGDRS